MSLQEANELAQGMLGPDDAFIHPFDDQLLWEGHATLVDELAQADFCPTWWWCRWAVVAC